MKKAPLIVLAVVVLGILVAVVYMRTSGSTQVANTAQTQSSTDSMTDAMNGAMPPVATDSMEPTVAPNPPKTTPKLAYDEAVKRYGPQRIQFNGQCQATPNNSTFKSGLEIMLDNRAGVERSVVFSGKTYKIPAYDYAVVTLSAKGIIYIDCGASQNVAKLTVQ